MSGSTKWPTIRLEQVVIDIQPGFAQRPDTRFANTPQLRTNNISPDGNLDLSDVKNVRATESDRQKYGIWKGDVIFNNTNSMEWVGKTAFFDIDEQYVLSNHMTRIRVDKSLLKAEFLAYYLHYLWQNGASLGEKLGKSGGDRPD